MKNNKQFEDFKSRWSLLKKAAKYALPVLCVILLLDLWVYKNTNLISVEFEKYFYDKRSGVLLDDNDSIPAYYDRKCICITEDSVRIDTCFNKD